MPISSLWGCRLPKSTRRGATNTVCASTARRPGGRSARSAERGDETVRKHLETLGLDSVEIYQGWCRQRGLSPSLDKGPETLKNEAALATLAAAKRQMGSARALIEQLHAEQ